MDTLRINFVAYIHTRATQKEYHKLYKDLMVLRNEKMVLESEIDNLLEVKSRLKLSLSLYNSLDKI